MPDPADRAKSPELELDKLAREPESMLVSITRRSREMGRKPFSQFIRELSVTDRIDRAKLVTEALTEKVIEVIEIHEANKIIVYSNKLAAQIPRSKAANAFTTFQDSMFNHEVIKCIALWDRADDNVISIPAVVELIDDDKVLDTLAASTKAAHLSRGRRHSNPNPDREIQAAIDNLLARSQRSFAENQAERARAGLAIAVREAKETIQREQITSIKNLRDHITHNLTETRAEQRASVQSMEYGDEKNLLDTSVRLIENLYLWVNGTSFDIGTDCVEQAKKCAEDLWLNCRFEFPS